MSLETPFIGKGQHLVIDTGGVANPEHVDASVYELLGYPVYRHVALCTYQHLVLTHQRLTDGFDQRCRLARPWRPVDDGHVFRSQHLVDRLLLCRVEVRKVHGWKDEGLRFLS